MLLQVPHALAAGGAARCAALDPDLEEVPLRRVCRRRGWSPLRPGRDPVCLRAVSSREEP